MKNIIYTEPVFIVHSSPHGETNDMALTDVTMTSVNFFKHKPKTKYKLFPFSDK